MIDPALTALVKAWRQRADGPMPTDKAIGIGQCADELEAALAALAQAPDTPPTPPEVQPARDALELLRDMILATYHGQQHREAMHRAIMTIAPFLHEAAAPRPASAAREE